MTIPMGKPSDALMDGLAALLRGEVAVRCPDCWTWESIPPEWSDPPCSNSCGATMRRLDWPGWAKLDPTHNPCDGQPY